MLHCRDLKPQLDIPRARFPGMSLPSPSSSMYLPGRRDLRTRSLTAVNLDQASPASPLQRKATVLPSAPASHIIHLIIIQIEPHGRNSLGPPFTGIQHTRGEMFARRPHETKYAHIALLVPER